MRVQVIKQYLFGYLILVLFVSCSGLEREAAPAVEASPTAIRGVLATTVPGRGTALPAMVTVTRDLAGVTAVPTETKAASVPVVTQTNPTEMVPEQATVVSSSGFSNLRFALTADVAPQTEFPVGTDEIFALWEYVGMSPSDTVRRIWFRDDEIWLTREEGWNWGEYDSQGTMRDISVYDNEGSGLPPATYRLQLYINDELQAEASFVVLGP